MLRTNFIKLAAHHVASMQKNKTHCQHPQSELNKTHEPVLGLEIFWVSLPAINFFAQVVHA